MVRIITIHGTFAARDSDTGDSWWQRGSAFMTDLQSYVQEPLDVQPFRWSGSNSEMDRRKSGARLAARIHDCKDPPIVIGHSHGGSAAIQALLLLYLKRGRKCCDMVRGFVTIGTPMFRFRSNRNPFARFDVGGRLLLLFAIGLFAIHAAEVAVDMPDRKTAADVLQGLVDFALSTEVLLSLAILALLYGYSYRNHRRQRLFRKNALVEHFRDRYVALNHDQDEAINGLIRAQKLNPRLIRMKTVFISLFSALSFVLVSFFFAMHMLDLSGVPTPGAFKDGYATLESGVIDPAHEVLYSHVDGLGTSTLFQSFLDILNLIPVGAVIAFAAGVSLVVTLLVTPGLSSFLATQIKTQSFGDDGFGETIEAVAPGLDFAQTKVGTLPQNVQREMIGLSVDDAGEAIQRLRELLSSGELIDSKGADLMAQSMKFQGAELLHNAYFHSSLFARHLAAQLIHRFGLTPTAKFDSDHAASSFLAELRETA